MSMKFAIWICTALILFQAGCKNNPIDSPIKNPREYTWTIDTLAYPGSYQTLMYAIWGSSASNIYVVGHNDQTLGSMWRYDGKRWSSVKLSILEGGPIAGSFDLAALTGFAADNIFAVGYRDFGGSTAFLDSSLTVHFDDLIGPSRS